MSDKAMARGVNTRNQTDWQFIVKVQILIFSLLSATAKIWIKNREKKFKSCVNAMENGALAITNVSTGDEHQTRPANTALMSAEPRFAQSVVD